MKRVSFSPTVTFVTGCIAALATALLDVSYVGGNWSRVLVGMLVWALLGQDYDWTMRPAWILTVTLLCALPGYVLLVIGKRRFPHWVTSMLVVAWFGVWVYWYFFGQPDMSPDIT